MIKFVTPVNHRRYSFKKKGIMKFSDFTEVSSILEIDYIVGYEGFENKRISLSDFFSGEMIGEGTPGFIPKFKFPNVIENSNIFTDEGSVLINSTLESDFRFVVFGGVAKQGVYITSLGESLVVEGSLGSTNLFRLSGEEGSVFTVPYLTSSVIVSGRKISHPDATQPSESITLGQTTSLLDDLEVAIQGEVDLKISEARINQPEGVVGLDTNAKILPGFLPDSILGQVKYQGVWSAALNIPILITPPSSITKGDYYVVSGTGTFAGINFDDGDWIISNGTAWEKVDNTDAVTTVFGRLGPILAIESDYQTFYPRLSQVYTNPSWIGSLAWAKITGAPAFLTENQNIALSGDVTGSGGISIATIISNGAVTNQKLRNSGPLSVIGRSANTTGTPSDISSSLDGDVLNRASSTLVWSKIGDLSITDLSFSKITNRPTTLAGYGITDAYTQTQVNSLLSSYVPSVRTITVNSETFDLSANRIFNVTASSIGAVPTSRSITINGVSQNLSIDRSWSVGTVTSVGLSLPSIFSITISPVTTSGTLTAALATQQAWTVFSREGTVGTPSFQALSQSHIPSLAISKTTGLQTALDGKEPSFVKGNIVQGTGVTLSGTLTSRLVGTGNITISNSAPHIGTNLSIGSNTATVVRVDSSTGNNAILPLATSLLAGVMSAGDKIKLDASTSNTGTVTSVSGTGTVSGLSLSGTVTSTGNITLGGTLSVLPSNFASQTANTFLAAPNSTAGVPTFRTILAADIPNLDTAKITTGTFIDARIPTLAISKITGLQAALDGKEPSFTKNTGFNKNYGTTAGTVAQGNDSRIINGQTAFGWGDFRTFGLGTTAQNIADLTTTDINQARFFRHLSGAVGADGQAGSAISLPYDGTPFTSILSVIPNGRLRIGSKLGATGTPTWKNVWDDADFTSTNVSNWNTAFGWGNHASAGYVPNTRSINSGLHLSGGGNLSIDRTLSVVFTANNYVADNESNSRLYFGNAANTTNQTIIKASNDSGTFQLRNVANGITFAVNFGTGTLTTGTVPWARLSNHTSILAGTGLSGGGDLSANRTLNVTYGTTAGTSAQGNDSRITNGQIGFDSLYKGGYSFSNGFLVATDIATSSNTMFLLKILGNGYGGGIFDISVQGYNHNSGDNTLNVVATSTGTITPLIKIFNYNGFLHFWMGQTSSFQSPQFRVWNTTSGNKFNRVTGVTNEVFPISGVTRLVDITPIQLTSGTGVAGQVAVWNGASTQLGYNGFTFDATTSKIQLGNVGATFRANSAALIVGSDATSDNRILIRPDGDTSTVNQVDIRKGIMEFNGEQTINTTSGVLSIQPSGGVNTGVNITNNLNVYSSGGTSVLRNIVTSGSILIAGGNTTSNGGNMVLGGSTGLNNIRFRIGGTEHMTLQSNGNVFIGTTTALAGGGKLQVDGTVNIQRNAYPLLQLNRNGTTSAAMSFTGNDSVTTYIGSTAGVFGVSSTVQAFNATPFRVQASTGNTVIGGTLNVSGTATVLGEIQSKQAAGSLSFGMFEGNTSTRTWGIYATGTDYNFAIRRYGGLGDDNVLTLNRINNTWTIKSGVFQVNATSTFQINNSITNAMNIISTGFVGFGAAGTSLQKVLIEEPMANLLRVNRTGTSVNAAIQAQTTGGSVWFGFGAATTSVFSVGNSANLSNSANQLMIVSSAGDVTAKGDVVAFSSSDNRLKDYMEPIENALNKIGSLNGYTFVWNAVQNLYKPGTRDIGVSAQEIEKVFPELVDTRLNGYKAVKYDKLVAVLIQGINELQKEIHELKSRI